MATRPHPSLALAIAGLVLAVAGVAPPAAADASGCIATWDAPTCTFHCHSWSYINVRVESYVSLDPVSIIAACGSGASCYGVGACEVTWGPAGQENTQGICSMTWAGTYPSGDWGRCIAF